MAATQTATQAATQTPSLKLPSGQVSWLVPFAQDEQFAYNKTRNYPRSDSDSGRFLLKRLQKQSTTLFDGAYDYGNEKEAGEGIQRAIKEGLVRREEIFVVSKLWNNYHQTEHALKMARSQCDAWGLGYLDLYLIHFPIAQKYIDPEIIRYPCWWSDEEKKVVAELDAVPMQETWRVMETIVDQGIARNIGVSNVSSQLLLDMQTYVRIPISSLQIELHPYLQQTKLVKLAQSLGIAVTAYSSFGPQSFLELPKEFSQRAKNTIPLLEHPVILGIAKAHGKTSAQVLLRWATQRGTAVIPKSNSKERLAQNLRSYDFNMSDAELDQIAALDKGLRFNDPSEGLVTPLVIFS
ncbi:MAG: NAD(P)H-dependent D-xylose reductase (XR) [Geoglossum simile]|nr:MAG: NAD(P)H-dependent D-xylose reductase (XR) [Geoglossum simile]